MSETIFSLNTDLNFFPLRFAWETLYQIDLRWRSRRLQQSVKDCLDASKKGDENTSATADHAWIDQSSKTMELRIKEAHYSSDTGRTELPGLELLYS